MKKLRIILAVIGMFAIVFGQNNYALRETLQELRARGPQLVERRVFLAHAPLTLARALETIPPKYGLDPVIVKTLADKESGGMDDQMAAIRHEAGQMAKAAKITKSVNQQKMLASSHCALQILGLTARSMGIGWNNLYTVEICVDTGTAYFAKQKEICAKTHANTYDTIKCAARRYNGSGPKARKYADKFMEMLSRRLMNSGATLTSSENTPPQRTTPSKTPKTRKVPA